ncbi:MAG: iron ABC transporter permease, partial [Thermomicrobium sp.]|nr:iron ABC transporter permease [Thermomicrobium sp.]
VAVIVLDLSTLGLWVLPTAAFLGGIVATALTYRLAGTGERLEVVTLVLAGLAINAVAGAGTSLLIFFASDEQLRAVVFWSMGSLSRATWRAVFTALPFVLLGLLLAPRWSRALDLLTLGERDAFYLGVPIARLRWHLIAVAALLTGAAVSVAGTIAFVGLIVPHVIRLAAGPSHRQLLPLSAAGGALTVLLADLVARTVVAPAELPIGVIMGLVGGPFFLWLVRRTRRAHGGWG